VFVYLGDNGWLQPTAPVADHPWYFGAPRGKGSAYENGVRTPVILHWLGQLAPREELSPISTIDLAPTLLRLAGQPVPAEMRGVDLLDHNALAVRPAVYGATFKHNMNLGGGLAGRLINRWLVSGRWKLIANQADADVELYDLARDSGEHNNLAENENLVTERLLKLLDQWWAGVPKMQTKPAVHNPS